MKFAYFYVFTCLVIVKVKCEIDFNCVDMVTEGENKTFKGCLGIPYAYPPLNDLRFSNPKMYPIFNESLNYTEEKENCIGIGRRGVEDCLYLNIFYPEGSRTGDLKPVLVYIPGHFFLEADTSLASARPDYFIDQDLIVVTVNYRQGLFGFGSADDSGNWGIKDIWSALIWINSYIDEFGGDDNRVTVLAHGSGAVCVSILQQNSEVKGLFQHLILQSGSSLVSWGRGHKSREFFWKVAEKLNLDTSNSSSVMEEMKKYPNLKDLQEVTKKLYREMKTVNNPLDGLPIGPRLEVTDPMAVFTDPSHESLFQGNFVHVPTLMGFTSMEAITSTILYISGFIEYFTPKDYCERSMNINDEDRATVGEIIRQYYFPQKTPFDHSKTLKYVSDILFVRPIMETARQSSKYNPVFLYVFNKYGIHEQEMEYPGISHEAELPYLFPTYKDFAKVPSNDSTRVNLITLWTNFIRYGHPTPLVYENDFTWLKVNDLQDHSLYASIDESVNLRLDPFHRDMAFYDNIYSTYGNPPFDSF